MKKVLKVVGNIITSLLIIILVAILMIAIYTFIELDIKENEYCNIFGYSIFQIETGSMEDTLKIEDIILLCICSVALIRKDRFWIQLPLLREKQKHQQS